MNKGKTGIMADFMVRAIRTGQDSYRVELVIHKDNITQTSTNLPLKHQLYERLFDLARDCIKANS